VRILVLPLLALSALLAGCSGDADAGLPMPLTHADKVALIASLPEPYRSADLANGIFRFQGICKECHTLGRGSQNLTGPNLFNMFDQVAGARTDFIYSDAIKNAGFKWDAEHLQGWLTGPQTYLPGAKMTFQGLPNEKDRIDLIVYLMTETGYRTPGMLAASKPRP